MKTWGFWKPLDDFEAPALDWVTSTRLGGPVEQATELITRAGEHGMIWYAVAAVGAAVDKPRRSDWIRAGSVVAASYAANTALKFVARRRRPAAASFGTETELSFPSSHAVTSFAAARLMAPLLPGPYGPLGIYLAAISVTGSRLHFCVHYPSDLVVGALLGDFVGRTVAE